ncbi:MAG: hypothetical protein R3F11_28455 [Verrucomicrobiales bacterium]
MLVFLVVTAIIALKIKDLIASNDGLRHLLIYHVLALGGNGGGGCRLYRGGGGSRGERQLFLIATVYQTKRKSSD